MEVGVKSCGAQLLCLRWSARRRLAPYRGCPSIVRTGSFFVYEVVPRTIFIHISRRHYSRITWTELKLLHMFSLLTLSSCLLQLVCYFLVTNVCIVTMRYSISHFLRVIKPNAIAAMSFVFLRLVQWYLISCSFRLASFYSLLSLNKGYPHMVILVSLTHTCLNKRLLLTIN